MRTQCLRSIILLSLLQLACDPIASVGGTVGNGPAIHIVDGGSSRGGGYGVKPYITNGSVDTGHPSAGKLMCGGAGCTATLIGKRTVLTAGHCVDGGSATFTAGGKTYSSVKIIRHPSYGGGNTNDVAVVLLGQDVQGVTPSPIATSAPTNGLPIVLVGFGKTGEYEDDFGTKRMGSNTISSVGNTTFSFSGGPNICNGDSGGPTFVLQNSVEVVAGVHSTKSGFCGQGGTDMRVDVYRQWITTSAGGDVVTPGSPPPTTPPSTTEAREGQSCAALPCRSGLACTEIFGAGYPQLVGKYCLERCATLGHDANCDGEEFCTESKNAGLVCFNPNSAVGGFCSNCAGGSTSPTNPTPPPTNPTPPSTPPSTGSCGSPEESQVFDLLNKVRAANGMGAVACDPLGTKAARAHSQDMCDRGYFDHYTPEGKGPWDRLQDAGASFGASAENIAMGYQTPQDVHDGWMGSSGHRDNMLTPSWHRAGIGRVSCGGTPYWTEVFMD
jgi:uncharacterized protein YkwD